MVSSRIVFHLLEWRLEWFIDENAKVMFTALYTFLELQCTLEASFHSIGVDIADLRLLREYPDI